MISKAQLLCLLEPHINWRTHPNVVKTLLVFLYQQPWRVWQTGILAGNKPPVVLVTPKYRCIPFVSTWTKD